MCGFLLQLSLRQPGCREAFDRARDRLAHRGPDAARTEVLRGGHLLLGHRRLSILDLTDAGHQPMHLDHLWVIFNGEIYNYPDLKRELEQHGCVFRTHCDTEVLLHGYRVWGEALPDHLAGMFSFCIWDDHAGKIFAARDHAGQKPFYYIANRNRLVAASEVKAILPLLDPGPALRRESIKEFFIYDDIPDPYTWHRDVMSLPPGHAMSVMVRDQVGSPTISTYWKFVPPVDPIHVTNADAMDAIGDLLKKSVQMHQLADVEVGAFLSGGLDSSGVVALEAGQRVDPVRTYTVGYKGEEGEIPLAREVAHMLNCRHTEAMLAHDGMDAAFERSLRLFDMPFGDPSQYPTYEVSKLAATELKVVLTGDGGDEVFGGYWDLNKYMGMPPVDFRKPGALLKRLFNPEAAKVEWQATMNICHSPASPERVNSWLGPELKGLVDYDVHTHYKKHWHPELDPFRRAQWLDFKTYLPTVLKKVDRCSMAHSLEARCPMLLPELIEYAFCLPVSVKNPGGEFKHLYREWLKSQKLVPDSLHRAPKKGFGVAHPAARHLRDHPVLKKLLRDACDAGWLSPQAWNDASAFWARSWRFALISRALMRED